MHFHGENTEKEPAMQVGLTEAARLTGKDASTITRACNSGRLSFMRDDAGNRIFDVAELERVYGKLRTPEEQQAHDALGQDLTALHEAELRAKDAEIAALQREKRLLEDVIADLRRDREKWQEQAGQVTRLLTDRREQEEWQVPELATLAGRLRYVLTGKAA
jgi:chromosome segregation ATPase